METYGIGAGIIEDISPVTDCVSAKLEPGDLFVQYTDGVTEVRNAQGVMCGGERLAQSLAAFHDGPAKLVRERILRSVAERMAQQDDDTTLLVARYGGV